MGGDRRVFAGRRISLPSIRAIAIVVVVGFAAGIGVGWGSGLIAERLAAPEPSPSASPSPSPTLSQDVTLPPMAPVTRERDAGDALVGLNDLSVVEEGEQSYTVASEDAQPEGTGASVRWVRVEYEDGLNIDGEALSAFVLNTLNDPRGWGARGRYEFVPTEGASDLRIVIASPYTAATICPEPHEPANGSAVVDDGTDTDKENTADAEAESTPEPTTSVAPESCAQRGVVMLSQYDWVAGLADYGDDRTAARQYLINHFVGHTLGEQEGVCGSGLAQTMTDQTRLPDECDPNPWPWPEEPVDSPEPTPSPSAREDENE